MLKRALSLLALALLTVPAFAENQEPDFVETCELAGQMRLNKNTQIYCASNLKLARESEIVTQGYELMVYVQGTADMSHGLKIRAFDEPRDPRRFARHDAGSISFIATTSIGKIEIENQALSQDHSAGDVHLEFVSTKEYDHKISQDFGGGVEFIRNGVKEDLLGPLYKPKL